MTREISKRDREILSMLIADYIATADAVGSRTIAKKHPGHLSPATIRNVMSDLTDMGLLEQLHTSAGRIPTDEGFRYYVGSLLKRRELTEEEMEAIREKCGGDERGIGAVLQKTSRLLAAVSHYVGIVATPSAERIFFKQIEFVPLSGHRLLVIFVSQDGMVENRVIEAGEEFSFPEIEKIANYCNHSFTGLTLDESLEKAKKELAAERADYDQLLKSAMSFSKQIMEGIRPSDIVMEGEIQLLDSPEFADSEKFRCAIEALEEKRKLLHILERCREGEGVRIFIGADAKIGDLHSMSLVSAPYFKDGKVVGTLGVIGPTRMDYSRVVPIVDFTAKILGDVLEK